MTAADGPGRDHRVGRQRRLLAFLRIATVVSALTALVGVIVPGSVGRAAAGATVAALIAVPVVRVLWLTRRWAVKRDWRYVATAVGLLAILGTGALVA
ncbi:MAG: DUF1634 domain-containing protein [Actinomycetota bacterium]